MEFLNQYSGLFSLLAVLASIVIPIVIYEKGKSDKRKDAQEELDAMNNNARFPMSMEDRNYYVRRHVLEKQARRK